MEQHEKNNLTQKHEYDHFTVTSINTYCPLEWIDSNAPIKNAINLMLDKQYSQLPVFDNNDCIGSVTLESMLHVIANQAHKSNLTSSFLDWPVKRFVDSTTKYARSDDDLLEHAEIMANEGYILIGDHKNVKSILTNCDLVRFLKLKTEPFLLLREIETSLRYIIYKTLRTQKLESALQTIRTQNGLKATKLEELTLNDLRQIVTSSWADLKKIFIDKKETSKQLEKVRQLRNQILHFKGHLIASHLHELRLLRNKFIKMAKQFKD